jgi:hypothetical protein
LIWVITGITDTIWVTILLEEVRDRRAVISAVRSLVKVCIWIDRVSTVIGLVCIRETIVVIIKVFASIATTVLITVSDVITIPRDLRGVCAEIISAGIIRVTEI